MTPGAKDYFRYLATIPDASPWGICVMASGRASVRPGDPYPQARHPGDHHFDWAHGRVLEALQVVMVSGGGGWLETRAAGRRHVRAGMVFLLLPKMWHRYRPDPRTGWQESWIEMAGPVVDRLMESGTFSIRSVLHEGAVESGVEEAMETVHKLVQAAEGFQPELSAAGLRVLALIARAAQSALPPSRIQRAVTLAERYLEDHHAEPVNMEALAARLGVGYSHFRRAFRAKTGSAPWQYVVRVRLARARRLLAASDATLEEMASRVGYNSAFHLSNAFKQAFGISPDAWRRSLKNLDDEAADPP